MNNKSWLYWVVICFCFLPFVSPAVALCIGIVFSFLGIRHDSIHRYTSRVLQVSIVLLGFGMGLEEVITASKSGFVQTLISVSLVMTGGIVLGRLLKVEKNTTLLIAAGTAICGGSAIAAVAPIIKSENYQNSFALIVVFVLNAIALLLFPFIGQRLGLSQEVFGNWAAIAIHDTSSVVGACSAYGEQALQVGTTVKLTRTLWIIPLALCIAFFNKNKTSKITIPWFIFLFVVAIVIGNYIPGMTETNEHLSWLGKKGMMISLFFIGASINLEEVKKTGVNTFLLGILLWFVIAVLSLYWIKLMF